MDDDRIVISSGSALTSEAVVSRSFATSFRGYDQAEVRVFLKRIGEELVAAADREAELRKALHDALNRAAHPELDEAVLTNALGEHTARLLTNARETAALVVSEAESRATRMLQEGEGRIARMRAEAETLLSRRAEEAERLASGLRQAADTDARTVRERARADAQAEIEAARTQGRDMLAEAKELRERMLSDLVRRRRIGEKQIQQLRAGHQRLLEAYGVVRRTLEEATGELSAAEAETRPALEAVLARPPAAGSVPRRPDRAPEFTPHPFPVDPNRPPPAAPPAGPERPSGAGDAGPERPPEEAVAVEEGPERPSAVAEAEPAPPSMDESAIVATPPRPVDDPAGVAALGAGDTPSTSPLPDPDHPRARLTPNGSPGPEPGQPASESLPPVDLAAPGEEVRVVREAANDEAAPGGEASPAGDDAGGAEQKPDKGGSTRRRLRRRARGQPKEEEEESGGAAAQVEELFARLRSAQARADAPADPSASSEPEDAPRPEENEPDAGSAKPAEPSPPAPVAAAAAEVTEEDRGSEQAPAPAEPGPQVADEKALYRRDELLDPIDSDLSRRLKRVLQDEQNEVLDRLRRQRRPVPEDTLPDVVGQTARYQSVAAPLLRQAARTGAGFVSGSVGAGSLPESDTDASADAWAADLAIELIVPLRERLERALQEDSSEEGDDGAVSERLSASYRQWKLQQVEQVARHYSSAAFALGAFGATEEGATMRWVVDDEGPCPDCEDNALAGPTPKGQSFPTGQTHPPAHPGCRCLLVPTGL